MSASESHTADASDALAAPPASETPPRAAAKGALRRLLENRKAAAGLAIVTLFVIIAAAGSWLTPYDPSALVGLPHEAPSWAHPFGTTGQGQDVLAQTMAGARVSLLVGACAGLLVTAIGAMVGVASAYFGGWVDDLFSLATNVFLILPGLPLAVIVAAYLPPGPTSIGAVLVVTGWAWNARVLRAQALSIRERDFVAASIVSGEGALRIMTREILPNMTSLLVSGLISATTYAVGAEVGLEFLGVGDLSRVTWGTNLYWASNDAALLVSAWWTIVPTGLSIALFGFALTLINFGIDEMTSPRLYAERGFRARIGRKDLRMGAPTPVVMTDAERA